MSIAVPHLYHTLFTHCIPSFFTKQSGDSYQYIARVVLVEAAASKCSQLEATADVLAAIAPGIVSEYYTASVN